MQQKHNKSYIPRPPTSSTLALLNLTDRDRRGLAWLKRWARSHITRVKRRRKYLPRGAPFDPNEANLLRALLDLERSADRLLEMAKYAKSQGSGKPAGRPVRC